MLDAWQRPDLLLSLLGNPNLHVLAVFFCHDFASSSGRHQGTGWYARNHIKECKKGPVLLFRECVGDDILPKYVEIIS